MRKAEREDHGEPRGLPRRGPKRKAEWEEKRREGGPRVEAKGRLRRKSDKTIAYFFGGNKRSTSLIDCSEGLLGLLTPGVTTRVRQPFTTTPEDGLVGWPLGGGGFVDRSEEGILSATVGVVNSGSMTGARGGLSDDRARWR
jgi:hypothetical protein